MPVSEAQIHKCLTAMQRHRGPLEKGKPQTTSLPELRETLRWEHRMGQWMHASCNFCT